MIKSYIKLYILFSFLLLLTGFLSGWLAFGLFGDMANSVQVLVISKEALIAKEEERIKNKLKDKEAVNEKDPANNIFFGRYKEVLTELDNISSKLQSKKVKVVLVSEKTGLVKNGVGISASVHEELLKKLGGNK